MWGRGLFGTGKRLKATRDLIDGQEQDGIWSSSVDVEGEEHGRGDEDVGQPEVTANAVGDRDAAWPSLTKENKAHHLPNGYYKNPWQSATVQRKATWSQTLTLPFALNGTVDESMRSQSGILGTCTPVVLSGRPRECHADKLSVSSSLTCMPNMHLIASPPP